jgi:hypothetical protein
LSHVNRRALKEVSEVRPVGRSKTTGIHKFTPVGKSPATGIYGKLDNPLSFGEKAADRRWS